MSGRSRITDVGSVPADGSFLFTVRDADAGDEREAILVRAGGAESSTGDGDKARGPHDDTESGDDPAIRGWLNYCQHLTHVRLDKGDGAPRRGDELVCTNHGAMFDVASGLCTFGPCEGAYLEGVVVDVADGAVYLTDDGYDLVGTGPIDRDDADLASTSNVEF